MLKTLLDLLNIESYSKQEEDVAKYVTSKLSDLFLIEQDEIGNVYCTSKKYSDSEKFIMLNAHMDSVRGYSTIYSASRGFDEDDYWYGYSGKRDYVPASKLLYYKEKEGGIVMTVHIPTAGAVKGSCVMCKDFYSCYTYKQADVIDKESLDWYKKELTAVDVICSSTKFEKTAEVKTTKVETKKFELFYDEKTKKITSNGVRPMGGDDKCGMAIAMQLAKTLDLPIKLFFSVQEEIGCIGVKHAIATRPEFFEDCIYSITCDRKGGTDICVTTGGEQNASNYFLAEIAKWGIVTGVPITLAAGTSSDNFHIKKITKNAINLAAGYYSPHTNSEYVMYNEVQRTYKWVKNFITKGDFVERNVEGEE